MDRAEIARLVDALDHPDGIRQREVMDQLVAMGPDAVDALRASLDLVPARVQAGLVQVLGEIGDKRALITLMRFIFDNRTNIEAGNARGLAMKSVVSLITPDDAGRILSFLMDVSTDADPFVRGWIATGFGKIGDPRATPILKDMVRDESAFVQERAQEALSRVAAADTEALDRAADSIDDDALLARVRRHRGGEFLFWLEELKSRENAFELATALVRGGGRSVIAGLQVLQELDDPRVRSVASSFLTSDVRDADATAVAMRMLARRLDGDATELETEAIRALLYHQDRFVRLAAIEAAAASGASELRSRIMAFLDDREDDIVLAAARGLSRGLSPADRGLFPELERYFREVHARRQRGAADEMLIRIEAYLVRAIKRVFGAGGFGRRQAQSVALLALEDAAEHRPLLVTGMELLDAATPESGIDDPAERWSVRDVHAMVVLLDGDDSDLKERALDLLLRGGPAGLDAIVEPLSRLAWSRGSEVAEKVVPLLLHVGTPRAIRLLEDLAKDDDEGVKLAAESALRLERNRHDVIDAEFEDSW